MNFIEKILDAIGCDPIKFVDSLKWLGQGMLCIIIVMTVLILITTLLNKIPAKEEKDK